MVKIKIWLIGLQMKLILCNIRSIITTSAQKEIIGLVLLRISAVKWCEMVVVVCQRSKPLFIFNMLSLWVTQSQPRVTNLFTSLQIFTAFSKPDHHSDPNRQNSELLMDNTDKTIQGSPSILTSSKLFHFSIRVGHANPPKNQQPPITSHLTIYIFIRF